MTVNVPKLISDLELLNTGLGTSDGFVPEGDCFVFWNGEAVTFNGDIFCRIKTDLRVAGAFWARDFLHRLREIKRRGRQKVIVAETAWAIALDNRPKRVIRKARVHQILTRADSLPRPTEWKKFPTDVFFALETCRKWVDRSLSEFSDVLRFHVMPKAIFATFPGQKMRFEVNTGFEHPWSVCASKWAKMARTPPDEYDVGEDYIVFRTPEGLVTGTTFDEDLIYDVMLESCSRPAPKIQGHLVKFPNEAREVCEMGEVFVSCNGKVNLWSMKLKRYNPRATVHISGDALTIRITAPSIGCWYEQPMKVSYDGPPARFVMDFDLFRWIVLEHGRAILSPRERILKVVNDGWEFATKLPVVNVYEE